MPELEQQEEFSFKNYFIPLTSIKAITWIVVIGLLVYANMLFNGFVWDDKTFIQLNPDVQQLNIFYLFGPNMFNNIGAGQYRAFIALYFTVLHVLFGDTTFFYHIFQLIIHITNTVLIFYLFKRFFKIEISFFLALLFLIHPMQVESVSYIASSDNPIFTVFGLTALSLASVAKPTGKRTVSIFVLLLFSLLSKETGILFVFLVVLYRFLFSKTDKKAYALFGVITILVYLFMRFVIAGVYFSQVKLSPVTRLPFLTRLLNIPAVIFYYLKTFLLPIHLVIIQYWTVTKPGLSNFYLPLLADIVFSSLLILLGIFIWRKKRFEFGLFIFFCVWLIMGFGMYSQLFALDMTVADRWFYFPLIGLLGLLGLAFTLYEKIIFKYRKLTWTIMLLILCVFSIRTIVRNTNWQDPITLYTHDSAIQDNFELENSLGGELNNANRPTQALIHFKKSVAMFPHETNLFNLGLSYEQRKDFKDAKKYYAEAFSVQSYGLVPFPHKRLEVIYIRYAVVTLQHDPQKALRIIDEGLEDYPADPTAWYIRAESEYLLHNQKEAIAAVNRAYQLLPNNESVVTLYNRILHHQPINTSD